MHASGGISSGLGGLLVVFVGASSLVLPLQRAGLLCRRGDPRDPRRTAVLPASAVDVSDTGNYPAAGVLGASSSRLRSPRRPLARRIQVSEALARQRGVDLANLSELNEYIVQHLRESIVVVDARQRTDSADQRLGGAACWA